MSKEFIDSRIDAAHELIDQGDFQSAIHILRSIKIRVHDQDIEEQIKNFETQTDEQVSNKLQRIEQAFSDAIDKYGDGNRIVRKQAVSYLNFYDKLRKENDIY